MKNILLFMFFLSVLTGCALFYPAGMYNKIKFPEWTNTIKLIGSGLTNGETFGRSVALSSNGNILIAGAPDANIGTNQEAGFVYIYQWNGLSWNETKLNSPLPLQYEQFGFAVDISDDGQTAIVGAPENNDNGSCAGAAYILEHKNGQWSYTKLLASDGISNNYFGWSVSLSGDGKRALIGTWSLFASSPKGKAYIFDKNTDKWQESTILTSSDSSKTNAFGISVAISSSKNYAIIGDGFLNNFTNGAIHYFQHNGSSWAESILTPTVSSSPNMFGVSVSCDANAKNLLIGAPNDDDVNAVGLAYLFQWNGTTWTQQKFSASDTVISNGFGCSVSISSDGKRILIGAYSDNKVTGAAYTYTQNGNSWTETKIKPFDGFSGDSFGTSVTLSADGKSAAIGSPYNDKTGAVYLIPLER